MASKILTESEVRSIGYTGTATANLLCTYSRAKAFGCTAASGVSLADNQLVWEGSVVVAHPYVYLGGKYWSTVNVGASSATAYGNYYTWSGTDPATSAWGSAWRTPTKADWDALLSGTTHTWTSQSGVNGVKFTSGSTSMFVPAAGAIESGTTKYAGSMIAYWSKTQYSGDLYYCFYGNSSGHQVSTYHNYFQLTVRPVLA